MRWILAVVASLALLLTGCGTEEASSRVSGSDVIGTDKLADLDFSGTTVDGSPFDGHSLAGQSAVLWFWAPWCPTCRAQSGNVSALAQKYAGEVAVVGVGGLDSAEAIEELAAQIPHVTHLVDDRGEVWQHFRVTAQSTYTVIDADGEIITEGYLDDAELNDLVAQLAGGGLMTLVPGLDAGSLTLALGAGLVAAVNPCGFALLPAYLSLFVLGDAPSSPTAAVARALRATTALTLGFAAVFVAFGLAIAPVAASVQSFLPAFTMALGLVLAAVGLWLVAGRRLPSLPLPRHRTAAAGSPVVASWPAMMGFGASYAVASLGCTIAPFLAVVVTSFRSGSPAAGVVLFAAYAAGMGLTVGVAATAVALARRGLVTSMRRAGGVVPRLGGLVLAAAGAYVAWYGAWELRVLHGGAGTDPVVSAAAHVQEWLATRIEAIGLIGLALVLTALLAVALIPRRRRLEQSGTTRLADPDPPSTPKRSLTQRKQQ